MTPAKGSFAQIEMVDFKKASGAAALIHEDQETADNAAEPLKLNEKKSLAKPDIRAAADARGRVGQQVQKAQPVVRKENFFERFFGLKRTAPSSAPPPSRPR
jgi:hypothetical protein